MRKAIRLLDVLAALSSAGDLAMGLPPGESVRSAVIAVALARRSGRGEEEARDALLTALLLHLGCTAYAHERAEAVGDEIALNAASARTNFNDPRDLLRVLLPAVTHGQGPLGGARAAGYLAFRGKRFGERATTATCEVGRRMARRLGLREAVQRGLYDAFEQWDGGGDPRGLAAEESVAAARIARVASCASLFAGIGGAEAAVEALRARAGGMLDPGLCELFSAHADELVGELDGGDPRQLILEREPDPVTHREPERLREVAVVFADFADIKSPFTHGHSRAVAGLAMATADRLGLGAEAVSRLELAGLLHDLGRVAVSTSIWEKPGPLTGVEWEQVRLHPYRSERILAGSAALEPLARLAGLHHERLDGSGYHRGCSGAELPAPARALAVADAYQAMTQPRPHRPALDPSAAAEEIGREARAGRLDPEIVAALLEVAGQRRRQTRADLRPAGLTEREVEVLRLLAAGRSNREIAERLVISRRTAEHHVQHIYAKIGESSRAAAAVFALEHHLLDDDG